MNFDIAPIVAQLVENYPTLSTVIMVIGALRLIVKPLLAIARSVVQYTPSTADDAALDSVEQSTIMKGLLFVLDWFASVKLK